MADAYWNAGTITLTTNSAAVEGQNTDFLNSLLRAGDTIESDDGRRATIQSINSATSITLDKPWRGAGQSTAAYKAWYTPDDVTLEGLGRKALSALASGNLSALAGLTSAANKLPFFTGSGTMDTTDLTAKGREIIGAADSAAARSAVGAMRNLDAFATAPLDSNFNDYTDPGPVPILLRAASGGPNEATAPVPNTYFYVLNFAFASNRTQVAFPYAASDYTVYSRTRTGASWSNWRAVVSDAASIVSGVFDPARIPNLDAAKIISGVFDAARIPDLDASKITAGVFNRSRIPVLVEYANVANGRYARFDDGTQICWQVYAAASRAMTTAYGSIFTSPTVSRDFPAPFTSIPSFSAGIWSAGGGRPDVRVNTVSNTGASYVLSHPQSNTLSVGECWTAIGRYM